MTTYHYIEYIKGIDKEFSLDKVEGNPVTRYMLKNYGWLGFNVIKFGMLGILATIVLGSSGRNLIVGNISVLLISLFYLYIVINNFIVISQS